MAVKVREISREEWVAIWKTWPPELLDPITQKPLLNAIQLQPCGHVFEDSSVPSRDFKFILPKGVTGEERLRLIGRRVSSHGIEYLKDGTSRLSLTEYLTCPLDGVEVEEATRPEHLENAVRKKWAEEWEKIESGQAKYQENPPGLK